MPIRVGINGFGRIGRLALRTGWHQSQFDFVHINEPGGDAEAAAHLLQFDSIHGTWEAQVAANESALEIDGKLVTYSSNDTIAATNWAGLGVDVVLECAGKFRSLDTLSAYLDQGIPKVVVSAPIRDGGLNVVMGVNQDRYDGSQQLVSAASCTTNCIAPVIKVLKENFGIVHGTITTIHDVTNTQRILDSYHRDPRRARAAERNLIPTTTGSATAIVDIFPELTGKLSGIAVRVPIANASLTDLVMELPQAVTPEQVNGALKQAASGHLAGILSVEERPLVSADFRGNTHSAIIDAPSTTVTDQTQVKLLAWYDNEIGYVNRLTELAAFVGKDI